MPSHIDRRYRKYRGLGSQNLVIARHYLKEGMRDRA